MTSEVGPWWGGRRGEGDFDWSGRDVWDPHNFGRSWLGSGTGEIRHGEDNTSKLLRTHVDWRETPETHVIRADLPGVKREEVKVQLVEDDNVLEISGERKEEREEGSDTWHRAERRRGMFSRRFRLPENASADGISCVLEDGVLTVTVPKKETPPITRNIRSINVA
ncbi:hypothetical protein Scep_000888 [Stephania cephalantha]|uniref:SHSP domain-containing protein n=1 Tax=Stephania cephalantha TaxID=152367 RepID=A0AAP0Q2U7_9MAGN